MAGSDRQDGCPAQGKGDAPAGLPADRRSGSRLEGVFGKARPADPDLPPDDAGEDE